MKSVARAAGFGLMAGMLLGAVALTGLAVQRLARGCDGLSGEECTLEQELNHSLARQQGLSALGLALVGAGLGLVVRRR